MPVFPGCHCFSLFLALCDEAFGVTLPECVKVVYQLTRTLRFYWLGTLDLNQDYGLLWQRSGRFWPFGMKLRVCKKLKLTGVCFRSYPRTPDTKTNTKTTPKTVNLRGTSNVHCAGKARCCCTLYQLRPGPGSRGPGVRCPRFFPAVILLTTQCTTYDNLPCK